MANSKIQVTEGSGKNIASYSFSETDTKELQRVTLNDSSGAEKGVSGNPIAVSVMGSVPVTGNIGISSSVLAVQSGAWTASVVGSPNISSVIGAVTPYAQPDSFVWGTSSVLTGTGPTSVLAAAGANLRNYITHIQVTNAAATAAIVDIKDSGANVLYSGYAAASGGGFSSSFPVPIRQTNTNASIDVQPRSQASIIAAISGYKAA